METTHLHSLLNVQMSIHGQRINATKAGAFIKTWRRRQPSFLYLYKV
ncbi:hypothetical protein DSBG_0928 [Desulfosporosinus sp. BG]|nr:hypothetical protein DSBG_0928 [Desulfosporosinus sp. BG]